jgi:hypothetical protein
VPLLRWLTAAALLLLLMQAGVYDEAITFNISNPSDIRKVFTLHSRPNATRKLLLDFDGHVTTGGLICSGTCTGYVGYTHLSCPMMLVA